MIVARTLLRWLALVSFSVFGLVLLNGAVFRAWIAGGPPNDNHEGWIFSAGNYLAWSLASVLLGIGLFLLLRPGRILARIAVVLLCVSALLAAFPLAREFMATDSCLDSGGEWSQVELRCLHG
jgi:hypothetical protein